MNVASVEARLRYRPTGDVLMAEFAVGVVDAEIDRVDADTTITWVRHPDLDVQVMASLAVIGARRRFVSGAPGFVPLAIVAAVETMFRSAPSDIGTAVGVEARAEARLAVPLSQLARSPESSSSPEVDVASARSLAAALRELKSAMQLAVESYDTTPVERSTAARQFLGGLDSMASIVASHRTSTPSAVSHLAANLRGGLPLSDHERKRLKSTLDRTLDPEHWKEAALELNQLAAVVRGERRLDHTEGT
ncbi:MAG: hypothetical protein O3B23_08630 [Actinomycetota bacterium]|nr:hypothetical protein [Actinomycetota bacterium]